MSRYRPPAPRASPYISEDGHRALRAELDELWQRRREVVIHLSAAAAEGDRSENAEYIYRKKQLREIDRRVGYLQRRLPVLEVVRSAPPDRARVFFGAWVTLCNESGSIRRGTGSAWTRRWRGPFSAGPWTTRWWSRPRRGR